MIGGINPRMLASLGFGHMRHTSPRENAATIPGGTTANTSLTTVHAETHAAAELKLVTREGDTVTLDWSRDVDVTYAGLRSGGTNGERGLSVQSFERSVTRSFSLQVQGDLNEQETADLQQVLDAVRSAMRDLRHGDVAGATSEIADLGTLDSMASLQADFEASSHVEIVSARLAASAAPPKPAPQSMPVTPAPVESPVASPSPRGVMAEIPEAPGVPQPADPAGEVALARLAEAAQRMKAFVNAGRSPADSPARPAPFQEDVAGAARA